MEADLARYGIDYCDRWRGRLSLRKIRALLRHLPSDSALRSIERNGEPAWGLEHVLLAQIWQAAARSKTAHPGLARLQAAARAPDPAVLASARRRAARRKQLIASGAIT